MEGINANLTNEDEDEPTCNHLGVSGISESVYIT